jgi:parallel beta-helix repeat protein
VRISDVKFRNIAGFAVLATNSRDIAVSGVEVRDSGSRDPRGRNNTTGGVLFEEGTAAFRVENSTFENIRGNGVWTHSLYTSPRNRDGIIAGNRFREIARDAIQVGHAANVRVERNQGARIGYPAAEVDATPVAIDTAGNVDGSIYADNAFTSVNGKCIDLDGFHHGEVRGNSCRDVGGYGIVMNNTNPDMQSTGVRITGNEIRGARYGGIFVIGTANTISGNRLLDLNTARCDNCGYPADEPDMLRSGIYLGRRAERPAPARGNIIEKNEITGYRMAERCIGRAPGIAAPDNTVRANRCGNTAPNTLK